MNAKRLLPEGMHVVFLPALATFMPFDPNECPNFSKKDFHRFRGDLEGIVIPRSEIEVMVSLFGQTSEWILRITREVIRERLHVAVEGKGVESLFPMPEEYHGDVGNVSMTRDDIQAEIDALRKEHQFELPIQAMLTDALQDAAGQAIALGLPFANRPHSIVIAIPLHTLKLEKASIRYVIRHEFAHCLVLMRTWETEFFTSANHAGEEWERACDELGIVPEPNGVPHETGLYYSECPECGFEGYQLRFDDGEGYEADCYECGALLENNLINQILYLTKDQTYFVEDDGRVTPSSISPDDFFGLVPEFFDE